SCWGCRGTSGSGPRSGRPGWARSGTRSCAASAPASRAWPHLRPARRSIDDVMLLRADSLATTHAIAAAVARLARAGDIIVLAGDMGSGKTAFAQGFGRALGITEAITSPTFTLVHSHPVPGTKLTLHHADLYRLDSTFDVDDLALHELAEFGGIVLIAWGDVAASLLGDHLEVRLRPVRPTDDRDDDLDDGGSDDDSSDDGGSDDDGSDDGGSDDDGSDDGGSDDGGSDDDVADFGLDEERRIELHATGAGWAGRWDRLRAELESYRC